MHSSRSWSIETFLFEGSRKTDWKVNTKQSSQFIGFYPQADWFFVTQQIWCPQKPELDSSRFFIMTFWQFSVDFSLCWTDLNSSLLVQKRRQDKPLHEISTDQRPASTPHQIRDQSLHIKAQFVPSFRQTRAWHRQRVIQQNFKEKISFRNDDTKNCTTDSQSL